MWSHRASHTKRHADLTTDIKLFVDPSDTKASQLKLVFDPEGNMMFLQMQETKKM